MAKSKKLQLDEFKIDDDLDFNFTMEDQDGEFNPEIKDRKSRSPITDVVRGTIGGVGSKFTDAKFLARMTRESLPKQYGEIFDKAGEVTSGVTSLYDDAVKDIKPQLSRIAKKVDKLIPQEQKTLKELTTKISEFFGDESKWKTPSREEREDQSVSLGLAEVFGAQQEAQEELEAKKSAESKIRDGIEAKRFKSNFGLLNSVNEGIQRLASYNDKVNQAYQKKSLELQFRSYFVQSELLRRTEEYFEVFKNQNEAITKNTALPEFVKIKSSEKFKEVAQNKFYNALQTSLFGNGDFIKKGMDKLKSSAKNYVGGIKMGLEGAMMGLDSAEQYMEMQRQMAEMGLAESKATQAGNVAGSFIGDWLGTKASGKLKDLTSKNPLIGKLGYKGATVAQNIPGSIDAFRQSDWFKDKLNKDGMTGKVAGFGDWLLSLFNEEKPDMSLNKLGGIRELDDPSIMNNKANRSLVEVIPGYLSRILREVSVISSGDKKTGLTVFNWDTGKFVSKKELSADVKRQLTEKIKSGNLDFHVGNLTNKLTQGQNVSDDQQVKIKKFLSKLSAVPNMNYTPENIKNTRLFAELDSDTKNIIESSLDSKITNQTDEVEQAKGLYELTAGMKDVKSSTTDFRGEIELFIKAGYGELLEKQGLVTQDADGTYEINEDEYFKLLHDEGIARSDKNAKQNIKPVKPTDILKKAKRKSKKLVKSDINAKQSITDIKPNKALDAIKKTKVYQWFYKLGKGDTKQHTGPMAQDVKQNMGEEAAPGGVSVDLVNLNGQNMAAIQALDEQQKKLLQSSDSRGILVAIQKDTSDLVKLIKSGAGTYSHVGGLTVSDNKPLSKESRYRDLAGNLISTSMDLMSKTTSDLFDTSKKIYTAGKDKIAAPMAKMISEAWNSKKDKLGEMFKNLFTKAGELGTKALDIGKDIIMNKLPAGYKQVAALAGKAKEKLYGLIQGAKDVYVKGMESPALRANLMKMGYYYDQATGKVINSIEDIKGPVVDKLGNIVLTADEIGKGLVDLNGKEFTHALKKLGTVALGAVATGYERAKNIISGLAEKGSKHFKGIGDWFNNQSFGFAFGTDKIYDVLVEMRDLMRGENPQRHEDKKDFKKNIVGPMPQSSATKAIDKAKKATQAKVKTLKAKLQPETANDFVGPVQPGLFSQLKTKFLPRVTTVEETEDIPNEHETASEPIMGPPKPSLFQGLKSKTTGLLDQIKTKGKESAAGIKSAKGFKGKAGALLGSLFSKSNSDSTSEENKQSTIEPSPPEVPKEIKSKKGSRRKKKTTTQITSNEKTAFNDTDNSGRRDGDWKDRLESDAKARKENKKDFIQADLKAKYKSDKNIMDTIFEKASGLFSMLTSGLGGLLGKAGILSKLGSVGGMVARAGGTVVSAASSLASAAPAIGSGLMAAGSSILSALGSAAAGVASVISSPVVLGAAAIAVTAYGAYKAYKYLTRDDVDDFADIRMKQYGVNDREGTRRFNHYMLQLEAYLEDKRVGWEQGKAYLLEKKIDTVELLDIFSIDKNDTAMIERFKDWFGKRFKPFFLTHQTALYSINNKITLEDIPKALKPEDQLKYLGAISFESGPYNIDTSPFKDLDSLSVDPKISLDAIKALTKKISDSLNKDQGKKSTTTNVDKAPAPPPVVKAPVTPEPPKALSNTNVAPDKKDNAPKLDQMGGEEGKAPEVTVDKTEKQVLGSISQSVNNIKQAVGPVKSGEDADQYLVIQKGVKLDGLNPELMQNFKGMVQEYGELTGKKIIVTSGSRSTQEQEALYKKDPSKAAKPGKSLHEFGLALDVNSEDLNQLDKLGLMRKYGFTRPVGGETWHMEPAGIQGNIQLAKQDVSFATKAIDESLGIGGGGLGSIPGTPKGKRDPNAVATLAQASAKEIDLSDKDKVKSLLGNDPETGLSLAINAGSSRPPGKESTAPATTTVAQQSTTTAGSEKKPEQQTIAASDKRAPGNPPPKNTSIATTDNQNSKYGKTNNLPNVEAETPPSTTPGNAVGIDVAQGNKAGESGDIKQTIATLSKQAGADPNMMLTFAAVESGLKPNAKANTSSASGLFQFTKSTWNEQIKTSGRKYNIDPNTPPTDVTASTLLASEYVKSNIKLLSNVKSNPNIADVYLAHFLGPGGARKFLSADPNAVGAEVMPDAAKANRSIFYNGNQPRTVSEIYSLLSNKLSKAAGQHGIQLPVYSFDGKSKPGSNPVTPGNAVGIDVATKDTNPKPAQPGKTTSPPNINSTAPTYGAAANTGSTAPTVENKPTAPVSQGKRSFEPQPFGGQQPNIISSPSTPGIDRASKNNDSLSNVSNTLDQQLSVQQEMRDILKQILTSVGSEKSSPAAPALNAAPSRNANTSARTITDAAVDLTRRSA